MHRILEVIVTSLHEAIEAELGGADRLELVGSLDEGGLIPSAELVQEVVEAVSIPVRVMLRENASMSIGGQAEIESLQARAKMLSELPLNGFVIGFIKGADIDREATDSVLAAAPKCRATFHRAFDRVRNPLLAINELKHTRPIDRVLTDGGAGDWSQRKKRIRDWQEAAAPEITILVAAGLQTSILAEIANDSMISEVHVGRAARVPQTNSGAVRRTQVARLKRLLS